MKAIFMVRRPLYIPIFTLGPLWYEWIKKVQKITFKGGIKKYIARVESTPSPALHGQNHYF